MLDLLRLHYKQEVDETKSVSVFIIKLYFTLTGAYNRLP